MYKVGDKVLCKNELGFDDHLDRYHFEIGKYYTVVLINDNNYNYKEDFAIHIIDGDGEEWSFDFKEHEEYTFEIFKDYFYTSLISIKM